MAAGRVDPELAEALAALPDLTLTAESLPALRAFLAVAPPSARKTTSAVEELTVPGPNPVRVLLYRPSASVEPLAAVLHLHAGGCVMGAPEMSDPVNRRLAEALGCLIVSVDYRLAPEHPFPAAHEDCRHVLVWLHANAELLGVDPLRIGVKGESAGGGLAVGLALWARDQGLPLAFLHLEAPMLDDRTCLRDVGPHAGEFVWTPASNRFAWAALLGAEPGSESVSPYAAPARASALDGLPATFISLGALDLFLQENLDFAARLATAGVPLELHVYPEAVHGFQTMGTRLSRAAFDDALDGLRRQLAA